MDRRLPRRTRLVILLSVLSVPVTLTHALEDFAYGIHARFGLPLLPAASVVALVYTVQSVATVRAVLGSRTALAVNAALALGWLVAAAVDHLPEILFVEPYRAGFASKALEVGVMGVAVAWLAASLLALRDRPT